MKATLYLPNQLPINVPTIGLSVPDATTSFAWVTEEVAGLLDCVPKMADVLACATNYAIYSIFDYEGEVNEMAMNAVEKLTSAGFDLFDEDNVLCGPVLIVMA